MKKLLTLLLAISLSSCVDADTFLTTSAAVNNKDIKLEGGNIYRTKIFKRITNDEKLYIADSYVVNISSNKSYTGDIPYDFTLSAIDSTKKNQRNFTTADMDVRMTLLRAPTVDNPVVVREYDRLVEGSFVIEKIKNKVRKDEISAKFSFVLVSDAKYGFTEPDTIIFENGYLHGSLDYYETISQ